MQHPTLYATERA